MKMTDILTETIHVTEASYFIHNGVILKAIETNWNGVDFSDTVAVRKVTRMFKKDNNIRCTLDAKTHVIRLSTTGLTPVSAAAAYAHYAASTSTLKSLAGKTAKKIA